MINRSLCSRVGQLLETNRRCFKTMKASRGIPQLRDINKRDREIHRNRIKREEAAVKKAKEEALAAIPPLVLFKLSCPGCGARYQHKSPTSPGYLPYDSMMSWKPSTTLPCQRCSSLESEAEGNHRMYSISEERFGLLLRDMASQKALGLVVCDIVGFPSSLPPNLENIFPPGCPLIIVVNKCDVLTESDPKMEVVTSYYRLLVSKWAHHAALKINDIHFVSARTGNGLPELAQTIQNYMYNGSLGSDLQFAYLMGVTNVGKSTLFNKLIPLLNNKMKSIGTVTESASPGTTVNRIMCPIFPKLSTREEQDVAHSLNQKAYKLDRLMQLTESHSAPDWFKSQIDNQLQEYTGAKVLVDTPGVLANDVIPESAVFSESKIFRNKLVLKPGQCLSFDWYKIYYVKGNIDVELMINVPLETGMEVLNDVDDDSFNFSSTGDRLCNKVYYIQSINLSPKVSRNSPTADICLNSLGWVSVHLTRCDDITVVVYGPRVSDVLVRKPGFPLKLPSANVIAAR